MYDKIERNENHRVDSSTSCWQKDWKGPSLLPPTTSSSSTTTTTYAHSRSDNNDDILDPPKGSKQQKLTNDSKIKEGKVTSVVSCTSAELSCEEVSCLSEHYSDIICSSASSNSSSIVDTTATIRYILQVSVNNQDVIQEEEDVHKIKIGTDISVSIHSLSGRKNDQEMKHIMTKKLVWPGGLDHKRNEKGGDTGVVSVQLIRQKKQQQQQQQRGSKINNNIHRSSQKAQKDFSYDSDVDRNDFSTENIVKEDEEKIANALEVIQLMSLDNTYHNSNIDACHSYDDDLNRYLNQVLAKNNGGNSKIDSSQREEQEDDESINNQIMTSNDKDERDELVLCCLTNNGHIHFFICLELLLHNSSEQQHKQVKHQKISSNNDLLDDSFETFLFGTELKRFLGKNKILSAPFKSIQLNLTHEYSDYRSSLAYTQQLLSMNKVEGAKEYEQLQQQREQQEKSKSFDLDFLLSPVVEAWNQILPFSSASHKEDEEEEITSREIRSSEEKSIHAIKVKQKLFNDWSSWRHQNAFFYLDANLETASLKYKTIWNQVTHMMTTTTASTSTSSSSMGVEEYLIICGKGFRMKNKIERGDDEGGKESDIKFSNDNDGEDCDLNDTMPSGSKQESATHGESNENVVKDGVQEKLENTSNEFESKPEFSSTFQQKTKNPTTSESLSSLNIEQGGFVSFVSLRHFIEIKSIYLPFAPKHASIVTWHGMQLLVCFNDMSCVGCSDSDDIIAIRIDTKLTGDIPVEVITYPSIYDSENNNEMDDDAVARFGDDHPSTSPYVNQSQNNLLQQSDWSPPPPFSHQSSTFSSTYSMSSFQHQQFPSLLSPISQQESEHTNNDEIESSNPFSPSSHNTISDSKSPSGGVGELMNSPSNNSGGATSMYSSSDSPAALLRRTYTEVEESEEYTEITKQMIFLPLSKIRRFSFLPISESISSILQEWWDQNVQNTNIGVNHYYSSFMKYDDLHLDQGSSQNNIKVLHVSMNSHSTPPSFTVVSRYINDSCADDSVTFANLCTFQHLQIHRRPNNPTLHNQKATKEKSLTFLSLPFMNQNKNDDTSPWLPPPSPIDQQKLTSSLSYMNKFGIKSSVEPRHLANLSTSITQFDNSLWSVGGQGWSVVHTKEQKEESNDDSSFLSQLNFICWEGANRSKGGASVTPLNPQRRQVDFNGTQIMHLPFSFLPLSLSPQAVNLKEHQDDENKILFETIDENKDLEAVPDLKSSRDRSDSLFSLQYQEFPATNRNRSEGDVATYTTEPFPDVSPSTNNNDDGNEKKLAEGVTTTNRNRYSMSRNEVSFTTATRILRNYSSETYDPLKNDSDDDTNRYVDLIQNAIDSLSKINYTSSFVAGISGYNSKTQKQHDLFDLYQSLLKNCTSWNQLDMIGDDDPSFSTNSYRRNSSFYKNENKIQEYLNETVYHDKEHQSEQCVIPFTLSDGTSFMCFTLQRKASQKKAHYSQVLPWLCSNEQFITAASVALCLLDENNTVERSSEKNKQKGSSQLSSDHIDRTMIYTLEQEIKYRKRIMVQLKREGNFSPDATDEFNLHIDFSEYSVGKENPPNLALNYHHYNEGLLDGIKPLINKKRQKSESSKAPNDFYKEYKKLSNMTVGCLVKDGIHYTSSIFELFERNYMDDECKNDNDDKNNLNFSSSPLSIGLTLLAFLKRNIYYDTDQTCLLLVATLTKILQENKECFTGNAYKQHESFLTTVMVWPLRCLLQVAISRDSINKCLKLLNSTIPNELRRQQNNSFEIRLSEEIVRVIISSCPAAPSGLLKLQDNYFISENMREKSRCYWDSLDQEAKLVFSLIHVRNGNYNHYPMLREHEVRHWVFLFLINEIWKATRSDEIQTEEDTILLKQLFPGWIVQYVITRQKIDEGTFDGNNDYSPMSGQVSTKWLQDLVMGCMENSCNSWKSLIIKIEDEPTPHPEPSSGENSNDNNTNTNVSSSTSVDDDGLEEIRRKKDYIQTCISSRETEAVLLSPSYIGEVTINSGWGSIMDFELLIPALLTLELRGEKWHENTNSWICSTQDLLNEVCDLVGRASSYPDEENNPIDNINNNMTIVMQLCAISENVIAASNFIGGKDGLVLECSDILMKHYRFHYQNSVISMKNTESFLLEETTYEQFFQKITNSSINTMGQTQRLNAFRLTDGHRHLLKLLEDYVLGVQRYGEFDNHLSRKEQIGPVFAARVILRTWVGITPVVDLSVEQGGKEFLFSASASSDWLVQWLRQKLGFASKQPEQNQEQNEQIVSTDEITAAQIAQPPMRKKRLASAALARALFWGSTYEESSEDGENKGAGQEESGRSTNTNTIIAESLKLDQSFLIELSLACCGTVECLPKSLAVNIISS